MSDSKPSHSSEQAVPSLLRLQSEIQGKVLQIALSYEGAVRPDGDIRHRQIVEDLGPHCQLLIFPGFIKRKNQLLDETMELGFELLPEHKIRTVDGDVVIDPLLDHESILETALDLIGNPKLLNQSAWIQDAFLVLHDDDGDAVLLQSFFAQRVGDWLMTLQIAEDRTADLVIRPTRYLIEGGNILGAGAFAFAGKDSLALNALPFLSKLGAPQLTPELLTQLDQELCDLLGLKEILWLGGEEPCTDLETGHSSFQPLFHLDFYLNLAGYHPCSVGETEKLVVVLGQPVSLREYGMENAPVPPDFYAQALEDTAAQLAGASGKGALPLLKLIRVPLPYYKGVETQFSTTWFSFNNCHLDSGSAGKSVFLPNFVSQKDGPLDKALVKVQQEVEGIYCDLGFDNVHWIGDGIQMQFFARRLGSLHCLTKVIRRESAPA